VEHPRPALTPIDELYLQRAYELAARGLGNTTPNPPVGAVVVRENRIVGEGYHHRAGDAHAEADALRQAAAQASGATLYVSLEPCRHVGRTPPCTHAVLDAGVVRVVAGTLDPTLHGGASELRERGVEVVVAEDAAASELIEVFSRSAALRRPYLALKMAMSLDGAIAAKSGVQERLSGKAEQSYVRELRTRYDGVMVGAGTVRVDDPQLTVRPPHDRLRPYVRIVVCETAGVPLRSRIFEAEEGYQRSIVLAPGALARNLDDLGGVAEVIAVGGTQAASLDLPRALEALRERGIYTVLCEGGPTLAARLIAARQVDRFYWAIAPLFLQGERSVPVLGTLPGAVALRFDRLERADGDVILSGTFSDV
jgi:diaminohydroxyphosphoribosylaminopyrimidine deaminase / 5-amino-6-(5-phosphoribosylamino)uracil reductase